jgi:hypothetical protein
MFHNERSSFVNCTFFYYQLSIDMSAVTNVRSFGGSVAIGTKDVQGKTLRVDGKVTTKKIKASSLTVGTMTNPHIPIGAIMIWSGATTAIPNHWKLCNGQTYTRTDGNGTITSPDLRDLFVRGGNASSPVTADSQHTHTLATANITGHSHTVTDNTAADTHQHSIPDYASSNHTHGVNDKTNSNHTHQSSNNNGPHQHSTPAHNHGHGMNNSGAHQHRCDLVDTRNGRTGYVSGGINYNYNSTAGSNCKTGNLRAYNSSREPRVDNSGGHQHNISQTGAHNHGASGSAGGHQHSNTSNHQHNHDVNNVNNASHTHDLQAVSGHNHQGFQVGVGSGMSPSVNAVSKLISYYVLAYVIKI